jgi:cysteinyl-tRNA synthetase
MPFQLYNTITRSLEAFRPADAGHISFYTCGPTVYDDAHIGNFRSFLAADVLRRWLESPLCEIENDTRTREEKAAGREVVHVMNITDVGHMTDDAAADGGGQDKMAIAGVRLAEAKKAGKIPADADIDPSDPVAIADFFAGRFMEDATMLGLKVATDAKKDPSLMPRATASIDGMQKLIAALIERGHAYVTGEDGSRAVYFSVASFPSYGKLSGNTLENLRGGAGGRVSSETQQQKKHPADFLLWKEDAAHLMKWDSPWGTGYPGWHIECSVMALDRLVPGGLARVLGKPDASLAIDLHSGGEDNIFPHHECERAQSCCATGGERFARFWFHARFLMVDGSKMSKSKGTMYTARQLFEMGYEPAAVRLELIKAHYRTNADFSLQGLKDSARMIERWRKARLEIARRSLSWTAVDHRKLMLLLKQGFVREMSNDLNVPGAIGYIKKYVELAMSLPFEEPDLPDDPNEIEDALESVKGDAGPGQPLDVFKRIDEVLGVVGKRYFDSTGLAVYLPGTEPSEKVAALLEARATAKKGRDFAQADAIRDELSAMGYAIKDIAGGKVEVSPA